VPVESAEYDTFDYKHLDERPLSLEEAVKLARQLQAADNNKFHRVVPKDSEMSGFRVESVPKTSVYAELLNRLSTRLYRLANRSTTR